ncbi:hypothetical protein [Streptomyces sp. NPDC058304]|uniref:hypothetical protein n=1 Tax=Streptomyces sp. NPDC058304 TaxID=3346437 RepID=UPI0036E37C22
MAEATYQLPLAADAVAWEPAGVRTDPLGVPATLTGHARRRELKFDPAWPTSHRVVEAWDRVQALAVPG